MLKKIVRLNLILAVILTVTSNVPALAQIAQAAPAAAAPGQIYYVAPNGVYANAGSEAAPTTLEGARDKIRALGSLPAGGVLVYLRGGTYARTSAFALSNAQDSGASANPIIYRAYPGETPVLSGGTALDPAWFSQVTSASPVWSRLATTAQGQLWQVDLSAHGITNYGTLVRRGYSTTNASAALELAFNGEIMELARWPNRGYSDVFDEDAPAIVTGALSPDVTGTYTYLGTTGSGSTDDGYPKYQRNGLVNGAQYYLYHCTWDAGAHKYWFISTYHPVTAHNCWPTDGGAAWWGYGDDPQTIPLMEPLVASATGNPQVRTQPEDYATHGFVRIPQVFSTTSFRLPGPRYQRWSQASDIWFQGLFHEYWSDDSLAGSLSGSTVTLVTTPSNGSPVANQPFAVFNLLEEIDTAGEWYLDRATGLLYFWPPASLSGSTLSVSQSEAPLLTLTDVSYVTFEGLTFEMARTDLVQGTGVESIHFANCIFRNGGGDGLTLDGAHSGAEYGQFYGLGSAGVRLSGGDRPTLTDANNYVRNSAIHHFARWDRTYNPGVRLAGVGQIVEHNEILYAPHAAIYYSGNEHQIRYNELGYVVQEANDAGAIYTGRDWGYRGNDIEYNFIHHVESIFGGSHGVYLDDAVSGMRVFGNVFYQIRGEATVNGGGRDNLTENNIIVGANAAHSSDRRAQAQANNIYSSNGCPNNWNLLGRINFVFENCSGTNLRPIDYQHGVWLAHYSALAAIPNDWNLVNNTHWLEPEGSTFTCNSVWDVDTMFSLGNWGGSDPLTWYVKYDNNLVLDPLFVDEAALDLTLRPDSPVYTQLPCFQEIPFQAIGITAAEVDLAGTAGNQTLYLNWTVKTSQPFTGTWQIDYTGPGGTEPPVTGLASGTRAYTLTGLTNYAWYTVTLSSVGFDPVLSDTVRLMPTDRFIYLPAVRK